MARKSKEQIKKEKDVAWFKRKYIWKDENLKFFVNQLSPYDIQKIVKLAFEKGMGFNWDEDDLSMAEEEMQMKKLSIWDLVRLKMEKEECK